MVCQKLRNSMAKAHIGRRKAKTPPKDCVQGDAALLSFLTSLSHKKGVPEIGSAQACIAQLSSAVTAISIAHSPFLSASVTACT
jgi:hypothetical protein